MSKTKSTLAASLLTLVLAFPAFAGAIGTPAGTQPPPPPPPTIVEGGNVTTPAASPENVTSNSPSSPTLVDILIAVLSWF